MHIETFIVKEELLDNLTKVIVRAEQLDLMKDTFMRLHAPNETGLSAKAECFETIDNLLKSIRTFEDSLWKYINIIEENR
jgi:hypothetical protein